MFYDAPFTDDCDKVPRVLFEMVAERNFAKKTQQHLKHTYIPTHASKRTHTHTDTFFNVQHCFCLYGGSCFIARYMITTLTINITGVHWFSATTCECIKPRLDFSGVCSCIAFCGFSRGAARKIEGGTVRVNHCCHPIRRFSAGSHGFPRPCASVSSVGDRFLLPYVFAPFVSPRWAPSPQTKKNNN